MWTLEQAIEDTERAYKESRNGLQYALKRGETKFAERCKKDAEEYGQFTTWLLELQERRKESPWIPCSERMPEEHEWIGTKKFGTTISDEVYVTFENEKGERFCQHMNFQNGELSRYDQLHIDTWYKGSKPIAWMPLPKPFEGGIK